MASSKVMKSSNSRNSDLSKRSSSIKPPTQQQTSLTTAMTVDGILRDVYNTTAVSSTTEATLLDAQITLIDTNEHNNNSNNNNNNQNEEQNGVVSMSLGRTVDDVWREIVSGEKKEMKEEVPDEMMTLEDFLVKAGAVDEVEEEGGADIDVKLPITERLSGGVYAFDPPPPASAFQVEGTIVGFGNGGEVIGGGIGEVSGGRGKRGRVMLEPLDRAAQQRQRRMIKNRESAARSRERKQAYQVELEFLAVRLEEENEQLLKEKAERTKERYKQLMENVVPVVEKQKQPRILRRIRSMHW